MKNKIQKYAIAPTDIDWFFHFREEGVKNKIVNFWTPTPWNIKGLKTGERLYFLLKSPIRKIGGYGLFVEYKNMKTTQAWKIYGQDNGVKSLQDLNSRTKKYISKHQKKPQKKNPIIGCILLSDVVFFEDNDFETIKETDFPRQVVKIKYFSETKKIVKKQKAKKQRKNFNLIDPKKSQKRKTSQKVRKGQPDFRRKVLKAYNHRCAISGESQKEALEAAHIQFYINEESNHIQNGICLRSDIHKLFDSSLISINKKLRLVKGRQLKTSNYDSYIGKQIKLPNNPFEHPSMKALVEHRKGLR